MKLMLTVLAGFLLVAPLAGIALAQKRPQPQTSGVLVDIQ